MKNMDNNSFVIRHLDEWFRRSLIDLAACHVRLDWARSVDPLAHATDVMVPNIWEDEMEVVVDGGADELFYCAGRFMLSLAFDLCIKYGANSGPVLQYVLNRLEKIAADINEEYMMADISNDAVDEMKQMQKIYEIMSRQPPRIIGGQHIYGN